MSDPNSDSYCRECGRETEVVLDCSNGDTVCSECGLVLEERYIDETSEWRTFANDESSGGNDPVRVGGLTNPLLSDGGLSTVIVKSRGTRSDHHNKSSLFGKLKNDHVATDRALVEAFGKIGNMADRLGLVTIVKDRANEIYKMLADRKSTRNKNQDAILAACLYIACRQERMTRSFKEMTAVASGLTVRDVCRAVMYVQKQLREHTSTTMEPEGSIHPAIFVKRFCAPLGLNPSTVKKIHEVVQKCEEIDLRRSPTSIAAAAIYVITKQSDEKPIGDIAAASGVGKSTIQLVAKEIEAKISRSDLCI